VSEFHPNPQREVRVNKKAIRLADSKGMITFAPDDES
jgi:hypothetical protein